MRIMYRRIEAGEQKSKREKEKKSNVDEVKPHYCVFGSRQRSPALEGLSGDGVIVSRFPRRQEPGEEVLLYRDNSFSLPELQHRTQTKLIMPLEE